jgi:flagellar protein FlaG
MDIASVQRPGPVAAPTPQADMERSAQNRELIQAVKAVNGAEIFGSGSELTFIFDRVAQRSVIQLINRETKDVIRQIPPEYLLRMAEDVSRDSQAQTRAGL